MKSLNTFNYLFVAILASMFLYSCSTDDATPPVYQEIQVGTASQTYPYVEVRLWPYFERFEIAALDRGFNIDLVANNVTGKIVIEPGHNSPGFNNLYSNGITLFHTTTFREDFWENATDAQKEIVVFHELAHSFLGRTDLDTANPDGTCISLMRSEGALCDDNYYIETRESYLDELFGI